MNFASLVALATTLTAGVCAVILAHRAANRRIRYLALSVALLAVCQGALLAPDTLSGHTPGAANPDQVLHMSAGLLVLTVVHFLHRENKDRRNLDLQVRCFEAQKPVGEAPVDISVEISGRASGAEPRPVRHHRAEHKAKRPASDDTEAVGSGSERRRARRYRLASPCLLSSATASRQSARVVNISRTGICFVSGAATTQGDLIELELFGHKLTGKAVRCQWTGQEYEYGVELQPVLRTTELSMLLRRCLEDVAQPTAPVA